MSKKIVIFIIALSLLGQFGFGILKSQAASYSFSEDFSNTIFEDVANTSAEWNTTQKNVGLKERSDLNYNQVSSTRTSKGGILTENRIYMAFNRFGSNTADKDVYLQAQESVTGNIRWTQSVSASAPAYGRSVPIVKADTMDGYVYVFWQECLNSICGAFDIWAQKFDASGNRLWGNGKNLTNGSATGSTYTVDIQMIAGYADYIFLIYTNENFRVVVQKMDTNLNVLWTKDLNPGTGWPEASIIVSGQVYVSYSKASSSSNYDIYLMKIENTSGTILWEKKVNNDITITSRYKPKVLERDGLTTVAWYDLRNGTKDLFAQRFDSDGNKQWANEIEVAKNIGIFDSGLDWNNNFYVIWQTSSNDIVMQKFGPNSSKVYTEPVTLTNSDPIWDLKLTMEGNGIGYAYWSSNKYTTRQIYGESFNGQSLQWGIKKFSPSIFLTQGNAQSLKINSGTENIISATLTATDQRPQTASGAGVSITYYLSINSGVNWEQIMPNTNHVFSNSGNDLRWKAILSTTDSGVTPVINSVSINYSSQTSTSLIVVISPNGGEQWAIGSTQTIRWNSAGSISQVIISLIPTDSNVGTRTLGTVTNSGSYSWTIPDCYLGNECSSNFEIPTGSYRVQISGSGVNDISDATFSIVAAATTLPYPNGTLVKTSSSDKIYLIENNQKRWITSPDALIAYGLQPNSQIVISQVDLNKYPAGPDIAISATNIPEGGLIRAIGDVDVWIIKYIGTKKFKRLILSPSVFNSYGHLKWGDIKDVDRSMVDSFITSDLVRAANDAKVYKLYPSGDTGQKRWITTADAFTRMSFDWDSIYQINQVDRDSYNTGQTIE